MIQIMKYLIKVLWGLRTGPPFIFGQFVLLVLPLLLASFNVNF
jgi:hypothetical protein